MVFTDISIFERLGRRNANISAGLALVLLVLVFLFKLPFTPEIPKDEELGGGVTVALGWPDSGSFDDSPSNGGGNPEPPIETRSGAASSAEKSVQSNSEITNEDKEVDYAAESRKVEENKRKLREIEESTRKRREDAAAATEARRKEVEEAERKTADLARKKAGFGSIFSNSGSAGGTGKGSGNSGKAGNGGDVNGDPSTSNLHGGGSGDGVGRSIGGGIGDRGVLASSKPSNNYNESGDVVVNVCVLANGQVNPSSVRCVKGTTTTSPVLRKIAEENAKSYRFRPGEEEDCGTITYRFKVK